MLGHKPKADELSKEHLQQLMIIVPEEGMNVEALQTKYPIIDWEVYSEDIIKFWKIIRVENYIELRVDEYSEMTNELLRKISILANRPSQ
ncbi:hypothetical protein Tco_0107527 [Tanacetum coccineum]